MTFGFKYPLQHQKQKKSLITRNKSNYPIKNLGLSKTLFTSTTPNPMFRLFGQIWEKCVVESRIQYPFIYSLLLLRFVIQCLSNVCISLCKLQDDHNGRNIFIYTSLCVLYYAINKVNQR